MYTCMSPGAIGIALPWEECLPLAKAAGFEGIDVEIDPAKGSEYYREGVGAIWAAIRGGRGAVQLSRQRRRGGGRAAQVGRHRPARRGNRVDTFCHLDFALSPMSCRCRRICVFMPNGSVRRRKILAGSGCRLGLEFIGPKTMRDGA